MAQKRPRIGDQYRCLDVAWKNEWIIEAIRRASDGFEYAHMRSVSDRTHCKTISLSAVSNPSWYALTATGTPVMPKA
jgi:hypothetical protein